MDWRILLLLAFGQLCACGDGGSPERDPGPSNPGGPGSGVSPGKAVTDLDEREIRQICEWSNKLSKTSLSDEQICTYDALLSNSTAECESERDACVAEAEDGAPRGLLGIKEQDCTRKTISAIPEDCRASVGALERCHRDLLGALVTDARRASCAALGVLWTPVPASCDKNVLPCTALITREADEL